jgi:hypothetical protein
MKTFKENDSVVYTDDSGRKIDTFVIFETDKTTGLTHINYKNLTVSTHCLKQHPCRVPGHNLPIKDAFSFEIIRKLKEKYADIGEVNSLKPYHLAKAS